MLVYCSHCVYNLFTRAGNRDRWPAYVKLVTLPYLGRWSNLPPFRLRFLRATAVPAGTAEACISYGNSVCPSVCHDPVVYQAHVR